MDQRVLQVTVKKELEEKTRGGETVKVPFTSPFVEVGGGNYVRRFERRDEPFTLRGEEEITAVLNTGHFDVVVGSERYETDAPAAAPAAPANATKANAQAGETAQPDQPKPKPAGGQQQ